MRGKSYLSFGGVSMGIAGSSSTTPCSKTTWECAWKSVDMSEFMRRIDQVIFDPVEYEKGLFWTKANVKEAANITNPKNNALALRKMRTGKKVVKMA